MKTNACTCKVGPGKFEGEPIATFLAWDIVGNGFADEDIGRYAFVRLPLTPDVELRQMAMDYGYCAACIDSVDATDAYGVVLWESEQGFVFGEWLNDEAEWNRAIATAEREDSEFDGDGYDNDEA